MRYDFSQVAPSVSAAARNLRRDRAGVAVTTHLTEKLLERLAGEEVLAIHVKGFFPAASARRAVTRISREGQGELWVVEGRATDTVFSLGLPRQYAERSRRAAARYRRAAQATNALLRAAFDPALSPLDRLRLELDELWRSGAQLSRFDGHAALTGLVRTVETTTLAPGAAGRLGACHIDDPYPQPTERRWSAILYLGMPRAGGELKVWDVPYNEANAKNLMRRFILQHAFDPGSQEIIHGALPRPTVLRPRPGDLVLLDVARPHAVSGFSRGRRTTLQTWVINRGSDRPLKLYS